MTLARDERAGLVRALQTVGPDAPTLCDGWTTRDLVAHLVLRDRRLDAVGGIMAPALAARTERVQNQIAKREWDVLLRQLAEGPPWWSPFKPLDRFINVVEMYVHLEDVLRAQPDWQPRAVPPELRAALRGRIGIFFRATLRKSSAAISLATPQGEVLAKGGKGEPVTIVGEPEELVLFSFGRHPVRVEFEGTAEAIHAALGSERKL